MVREDSDLAHLAWDAPDAEIIDEQSGFSQRTTFAFPFFARPFGLASISCSSVSTHKGSLLPAREIAVGYPVGQHESRCLFSFNKVVGSKKFVICFARQKFFRPLEFILTKGLKRSFSSWSLLKPVG